MSRLNWISGVVNVGMFFSILQQYTVRSVRICQSARLSLINYLLQGVSSCGYMPHAIKIGYPCINWYVMHFKACLYPSITCLYWYILDTYYYF